jgi:hypothetical protein
MLVSAILLKLKILVNMLGLYHASSNHVVLPTKKFNFLVPVLGCLRSVVLDGFKPVNNLGFVTVAPIVNPVSIINILHRLSLAACLVAGSVWHLVCMHSRHYAWISHSCGCGEYCGSCQPKCHHQSSIRRQHWIHHLTHCSERGLVDALFLKHSFENLASLLFKPLVLWHLLGPEVHLGLMCPSCHSNGI